MEETFTYDDMNRLTGITLKRPSGQDLQCSVTYDALGRMTSRQAVTNVVHKYFPKARMNYYLDYYHFEQGFYLDGGYYNPFSLYKKLTL